MSFTSETNMNVNMNVAGPYLIAFGALLLLAVVARAGAYFWAQSKSVVREPISLGPYEVALLTGRATRVVETALACLADAGAVLVSHSQFSTYARGPRADQPVVDGVQRQVLDLLTKETTAQSLARKFARTDTGAHLRRRLESGGYLLDFPNHLRLRLMGRMLIPLVLLTMVLVQLGGGVGTNATIMLLNIEVLVSAIVWLWCEHSLTLTRTRSGQRTKREIGSLVRKHQTGEKQMRSEKVPDRKKVQQLREAVSERAGEWNLSPGWIGSAPGIVPFMGWMGYLAERAEHWDSASRRPLGSLLPARKTGPDRRVGWLLRALGALCAVAALLVFWVVEFGWGAIALFVGCCLVGAGLATRGRKHLAVEGREALRSGQRPPVLYLRSFAHDALLEGTSPFRSLMTALGSRSSYIEEIARAVRNFGTLVAIGDPGSRLPGLGPAQIYVEPDSTRPGQDLQRWQAEVLGLLRGSALVLISAGYSDGLRWEFAQATANVLPERLVVFVPLNRAQYARFRELTEAYFPAGLPADPRKSSTWGKEPVYGLVHFDRDWTPHFVPFRPHAMLQLHLGRVAVRLSFRRMRNRLMHALYPVFRSNQVIWSGVEIPVFFGRTSRNRIVGGTSYLRAVLVLVLVGLALVLMFGGHG
ncbi:TIGR04222 domain-containing membrane protein [Saccharopolyspora tripterygii]